MKTIFLILFLALALALSGCVGPKDAPKGVIEMILLSWFTPGALTF
jgi:hypothetical protein